MTLKMLQNIVFFLIVLKCAFKINWGKSPRFLLMNFHVENNVFLHTIYAAAKKHFAKFSKIVFQWIIRFLSQTISRYNSVFVRSETHSHMYIENPWKERNKEIKVDQISVWQIKKVVSLHDLQIRINHTALNKR